MNTFEIRIFKNHRWTTESRGSNQAEAIASANAIAGDRTIDGVKVIEEAYDENEGLFREKTVFSYFKQDDKVFNPRLTAKAEQVAPPPPVRMSIRPESSTDIRAWLLVVALLLSLGSNIGLAIYMGDRPTDFVAGRAHATNRTENGDLVVYDLPPVTMDYNANSGSRAVKMRLGLELSSHNDVRDVQHRLSQIINRVANDMSDIKDSDLDDSAGMERLRNSLKRGV
ncbi:MAG: flagellar basal body-associated FliL family protein, partial [Gammaproteobacteria bacterium]